MIIEEIMVVEYSCIIMNQCKW